MVLPASIAGGLVGAVLVLVFGRVPMAMVGALAETGWRAALNHWIMAMWVPNFVNGVLVVLLAFFIAPAHKWRAASVTGISNLVFISVLTAVRSSVSSEMVVQLIALTTGTIAAIAYRKFSGSAEAGKVIS